jgi:hypothetical protein
VSLSLGAGWKLVHLSDRCIELEKDDYAYRKYLGRDGYVRYRVEPGYDRCLMINEAMALACANDAKIAYRMASEIVPRRVGGYQMQQKTFAWVMGTPEDPEIAGVKRP